MRRRSAHAHLVRPIAALRMVTLLQGCMRWDTVRVQSGVLPKTERVRVTLVGGTERTLRRPVVKGDNLVSPERTIPLAQIRMVQVPKIDKSATGFLALFIVGPLVLAGITYGSGGTH